MPEIVGYTPEQDAVLVQLVAREVRKAINQVGHESGAVAPALAFMGKLAAAASVDLFEGALAAPDNKVLAQWGPAHGGDGENYAFGDEDGIEVHYLWGSIGEGQQPWCNVFEWFGRYYVVPLQCAAPA